MAKENETPTPKSDNELLQEILWNAQQTKKYTLSIKDNVQFFAWIIIISFVLSIIGVLFFGTM